MKNQLLYTGTRNYSIKDAFCTFFINFTSVPSLFNTNSFYKSYENAAVTISSSANHMCDFIISTRAKVCMINTWASGAVK